MNQVVQIQGREINDIFLPTAKIFVPILETKRADIQATQKETYSTDQQRDTSSTSIILPKLQHQDSRTSSSSSTAVASAWVHGASPHPSTFSIATSGSSSLSAVSSPSSPVDLGMRFPDAARDVSDGPSTPSQPNRYLRPPGAMNMFTLLVLPDLYSPSLHPRIKGAILLAGPYTFEDIPADMKDAVRLYHGEVKGTIPLELLNLAKDDAVLSRRWSLGIAERDFPCLTPALEKFKEALTKKGVLFDEFVAKGHNHVSVILALETGQGEEWAEGVVNWIRSAPA
ncbi:hypothetical protein ARMSODRAFT_301852 [Armillaria solidipes]|uniref:Alpha/beta hydrolase fold-3 domain-containing protein n=1 Tax=Armillaria solidipes TaxID=1076256 RepID=A0A2H3BFX2_9AGAR|nr:hypothetical protein ARMSODRAFT_301852 [Armillaria solidipes]